jgi:hypothetical protein
MNESTPTPPLIQPPPPIPPAATPPLPQPPLPGDDPAERVAIPNIFAAIEAVLRHPRRLHFQMRQPGAGGLIVAMFAASVVCSLIYGVVVGTFSGGAQLWIAPAKIALGLVISAAICLPSLYIFGCLSGSQARLSEVCGLLAGMLLLSTVLLIGFAPVAWIFSESTESVAWMGALHLLFCLLATLFGLRFMKAGFAHTHARSQAGINVWIIIFLLVALQMTTALRPILGRSDSFFPKEKQFFLGHWIDCFKATPENSQGSSESK